MTVQKGQPMTPYHGLGNIKIFFSRLYVTTMVDLLERRVLFATEGKGADCKEKSVAYLKGKELAEFKFY